MPPFVPPKVKTLEIPYKVLVLRADPDYEAQRTKDPFYEFTGRTFRANTATKGAYSDTPN
jgi:hypothetical protein